MKNLLSVAELAQELDISEAAIRSRLKRNTGTLPPPVRLGGRWYWRPKDIEQWYDSLKPEPK